MIHFKAYFYADYTIQITLHVKFNEAKLNYFVWLLNFFDHGYYIKNGLIYLKGLTTKLNYTNNIIKVKWYFAIGLNPIQCK